MKIGNCERWRQWAAALGDRGVVSRRRAPLALEWFRQRRIRQSLLYLSRGAPLLQQFHIHLSVPFSLQFGSAFGRMAQGYAQAAVYTHDAAAGARETASGAQVARFEQSISPSAEFRSTQFLRTALERTRRVEHRVTGRELILSHGPGTNARRTEEAGGRVPGHWAVDPPDAPDYRRPPVAPPVNVDQIADTVMRQLDRRIGSWRERMGRL